MSKKAILTQADLLRIARAAKASGCRVEIKIGDALVTFIPDANIAPGEGTGRVEGVDYSRPSL